MLYSLNKPGFPTYVSSGWKSETAERFMVNEEALVIYFADRDFLSCASWVSRFPEQCEILYAAVHLNIIHDLSVKLSMMPMVYKS